MSNSVEAGAPHVKTMYVRDLLLKTGRNLGPNSYLSEVGWRGAQEASFRSDQRNRILVYAGAFNPPHIGHMACLADGLQHIAQETGPGGIVAAIVAPLDDVALQEKEEKRRLADPAAYPTKTPILLSSKERADLFSEYLCSPACGLDANLRSKVQVWAPGRHSGVGEFPGPLAAAAAEEGFYVDFVILRSPEYLYHNAKRRNPEDFHPQCSMVLFSEAAGRNNPGVRLPDGSLRQFGSPWSAWEVLVWDEDLGDGVRRTVWSTRSAGSEQRMLSTRNASQAERGFSSTEIREMLYQSDSDGHEGLVPRLRAAGAVSVEALVGLLAARGAV